MFNNDSSSVLNLKDMLFKVAECTYQPEDPSEWPPVDGYSLEERKHNSSIHLPVHEERLADGSKGLFATISSTVVILTDDNELMFWERVYKHDVIRKITPLDLENADKICAMAPLLKISNFSDRDYDEFLI